MFLTEAVVNSLGPAAILPSASGIRLVVTCPPKTDPGLMLDVDRHERGRNAKKEAHAGADHHQVA